MSTKDNLRILVIDDNPAIHEDFKKILNFKSKQSKYAELNELLFGAPKPIDLKLPSFQIDTAAQGKEGLYQIEKAIKEGNPYALAFVDIRMPPGWDGIETIKHIWALDEDIQIVICTAYSDYSWEETVHELGGNDNFLILKKPFDSVSVRQLAYAMTKKWTLMQNIRSSLLSLEKTVAERTEALQKSLSLTRATLESSTDGLLVVDNDGQVLDFNNKFVEMWTIPKQIMDNKNFADIKTHMIAKTLNKGAYEEYIQKVITSEGQLCLDDLALRDGRFFECNSQPQQLNGNQVGRVWSYRDLTQRVYLENKLEHLATHDPLTELPNRILLLDRIKHAISHAKRNGNLFAVMFIDLDRFKMVNDDFSHEAGDNLLKELSKRLRKITREEDTIARLSGDEFIFISLSESIKKEEDVSKIASKVLKAIQFEIKLEKTPVPITASIGISIYPKDGADEDTLIRKADMAMYRSKSLGGNQFQLYSDTLLQKT